LLKDSEHSSIFSVVVGYSHRQFGAKQYGIHLYARGKYMLLTYFLGVYLAVADSRLPLSLSGGDAERFVSCDSAAHTLAEEQ
jgi:hypothetical protein